MDEAWPDCHREMINPDCPVACLLTMMSQKARRQLMLARGLLCDPPETASDVLNMYARGQLRSIRGLGPRRIGEIEMALIFAGFDLTPYQCSAQNHAQPGHVEGQPED